MKVIDKRKKEKKWKPGDLICYYNDENKKHYGLFIKMDDGDEITWTLWELSTGKNIGYKHTKEKVYSYLSKKYTYFGKVNSQLEVWD
ncbi:hypothetical protein [Lactobacillus johnsonii]|uniref:hypothetical protein n=1 Tax=Lactobacillus johnsonii TaxID=33959 RepID=UPI00107EC59A|nr:hypothetical protein [Lactobacillus johnsonii]TGA93858.1 hypothetical protein E5F86_03590 [Lactobacillus johnsonii]